MKRILAVVLILGLPLANSYAGDVLQGTQPAIFTLAYQGPLSGPEAQIGIDQLRGVEFAIAKYNSANPRRTVQLIQVDDLGDPAVGAQVAPAVAANASIIGLIGPPFSATARSSLPFYIAAGLPLISPSACNPGLTDPSSDFYGRNIFQRVVPACTQSAAQALNLSISEGSILVRRAAALSPINEIYLVNEGTAYSDDANATLRALGSTNETGVNLESGYLSDSDFDSYASVLKLRGASQIIYTGFIPEYAAGILKALKRSGYRGKFYITSQMNFNQFNNLAGIDAENVEVTSYYVPLKDAAPKLAREFVSKTGFQPGPFATEAINATNVFLSGIKAGISTRQKMSNYIDTFSGTGIAGNPIQFTINGELADPAWGTFRINNLQVVYTGMISASMFAGKISQTITFSPPSSLTLTQSPFMLNATTTSGLTVNFNSTDKHVCSISGSTLTLIALGTCNITASQIGSSIYSSAPKVLASITVLRTTR